MTKELEDRIALLEEQLHQSNQPQGPSRERAPKKRGFLIWSTVAVGLVACLLGGRFLLNRADSSQTPLANLVTKNAAFTIYFPKPLPGGYTYKENSANIENGTLIYSLEKGNTTVVIAQQANPPQQIKIDELPGFKALDTPAGKAYSGQAAGNQVAIIQTESTLINISSSSGVPAAALASVAKNLQPLNQAK